MASDDNFTIEEKVSQAVMNLLVRQPFFGHIISKMNIKEDVKTPLGAIPTAATDGKTIYYNAKFFDQLDTQERVFVIAHEVMHCVYQHLTTRRDSSYNHRIWNMATDYAINYGLVKDKVAQPRKEWLYDTKYADMTSEQIYDDLIKNGAKEQDTMDVHITIEKGENGEDEVKINGKPLKDMGDEMGEGSGLSKEEIQKNMEDFQDIVIQAYQVAKDAGSVPSGIELLVSEFVKPKINWKNLIQTNIQSIFKSQVTWTKPNRRSSGSFILPTRTFEETVDICVSIDTSGSITEEMRVEFLSEILGILHYYSNFCLKIWCFDTQVHAYAEYDQYNIEDLVNYKLGGGGGTAIECNFEYMKKEGIVPKQFLVLTDGYNGSSNWGPDDYCPTTWIIHSNPKPQVPFGNWTLYERD